MKKTDILLPHRKMINHSLRKETEKLRVHIDEYVKEYDAQYQNKKNELENTRKKLNKEYEQAHNTIMANLSSYVESLQTVSNAIASYVSVYFDRQLAYKKKEVNNAQTEIVNAQVVFLSDQMREIGLEIELLRKRRGILSSKADVSDIVHLIQLSGSVLSVDEVHDAKDLLNSVNIKMDAVFEDDDKIEWYSLLNVRILLEERISFLAEIQYISWVIEQKIQLSKELKDCRDKKYELQSMLITENKEIEREIESLDVILWNKAKEIRFYWAKPMVYIDVEMREKELRIKEIKKEIPDKLEKKESLYNDKENVQHDIDRMINEHSGDSCYSSNKMTENRSC